MPLARAYSVALVGLDGHLVEVEADLAPGLPGFTLIGLPDTALHESRDRLRAAIANSGQAWPSQRITVGLSPASLPKRGSVFDVAMAGALLAAAGAVPAAGLHGRALFGELGLDGKVRRVSGVLPAVLCAVRAGFGRVVVPAANAAEARLVPDAEVCAVSCLRELLALLRGQRRAGSEVAVPPTGDPEPAVPDLADVVGQLEARRAVEIAAAGGHHLLLLGPPGAGKTLLAERLPGLLPDLELAAALEVTAIHSVAGQLSTERPLVRRPPYRNPHHTASVAALVGGGAGLARPGAVSLAHRGVLFLDEAPEFSTAALDALRQPLESGEVLLARAGGAARYPARFTLVLATNPCPCGSAGPRGFCSCPPAARRRYLGRLSGPLLDRVDLRLGLQPVSRADLLTELGRAEPTVLVRGRVDAARRRAARRLSGTPWRTNAELPGPQLRRSFPPPPAALRCLQQDLARGLLTARGFDRVLRVAWTIADLAGLDRPGEPEVLEARCYRTGLAG
jgi:magnesium chelatase family protein